MRGTQIIEKLKSLNPWHFLWIAVVLSEIFTFLASSIQSYLRWGFISYNLLSVGAIDALFVPLVVVPIVIFFLKKEDELRKLNRILRAKSRSSQALLGAKDEQEYLYEVCRIIVEDCGHALVWIGFAADDEMKSVRPVARAGFEEGYLDSLKITWADTDLGRGPAGTAIRTGKPAIIANVMTDPAFAPWKKEAFRRRYAAVIGIPLLTGGKAFGSLNIYSRDKDPFSEDEVRLLSDVAADLSNGIVAVRLRAAHTEAETALRDSEERYRALFANMLEGFAYCRMLYEDDRPQDFVYLAVNNAFENLTGLKDVVGKKVSEVIPGIKESNPELFEIYGKVVATGRPERFDAYSQSFGGWLHISVYSTEKEHFVAVFDNITERKQSEALLQESEAKFRDMAEKAVVGIYLIQDELFRYVNPTLAETFGYTVEELIAKKGPEDLVLPQDWPIVSERLRKRISGEMESTHYSFRGIKKDKEVIYVEVHGSKTVYKARPAVIGTLLDITERIRTEEALRSSEKKHRRLHETMRDAFVAVDMQGRITEFNAAYKDMLGYSPEELLSLTYVDISPEKWRSYEAEIVEEQILPRGFSDVYEKEYRRKDGTIFPVELRSFLIKNEQNENEGMWAIVRDVTEKKKLEDQLRHAQKMEAIGTLAGGIAHDFNNILNVIIGYGNMVLDRIESDRLSREHMNEVIAAAERAANLTRRLLTFSRKQVMEMKPIDVNETILGLEKMLSRIIGEDILFSTELTAGKMLVMADTGQIEQVLMNLASNARDAMPKGGRLTISTGTKEVDADYAAAYGYGTTGAYVLISVTDTGDGIDAQTQRKIFEPFFTTKGVGEGTGLGLAMAYGIIKRHNGYINVYSEEGHGTTFKILLPVIEKEILKGHEVEAVAPVEGGNETILVAEDDTSLRKLERLSLEAFGYTVITAEDGEEAIQKYMENRDKIQLVILDMIMPKKSGKEAYEEIRKINPDLKTLFASGYTMDMIHRKELLDEGMDFILKPVLPKDLLKKVREVLDS